ncbi:hypothetical protein [Accumulibacter sp.]|uniref:hypothetical protein n=1 Tax=Accumulibacter sp. TaxID=2053492 RepID=UPI00262153EA|nr:hypothetical protein [Accumulibacter sp.]
MVARTDDLGTTSSADGYLEACLAVPSLLCLDPIRSNGQRTEPEEQLLCGFPGLFDFVLQSGARRRPEDIVEDRFEVARTQAMRQCGDIFTDRETLGHGVFADHLRQIWNFGELLADILLDLLDEDSVSVPVVPVKAVAFSPLGNDSPQQGSKIGVSVHFLARCEHVGEDGKDLIDPSAEVVAVTQRL